jgi:hypothetical protein
MSLHSEYQDLARELIDYFSDSFEVTFRKSTSVVDPGTGLPTTTVQQGRSLAIFLGISEAVRENLGLKLQDRMLRIPAGDLVFVPDGNTRVIADSTTYKIIERLPAKPGATVLYSDFIVREL